MNYSASRLVVDGFEVLRLGDAARRTEVSVVPAIGNIAFEYKVAGVNYLWAPFRLDRLPGKPEFFGNPLMEPWANRLSAPWFHANGRKHPLNPDLGNYVKDDAGLPMHGLLVNSPHWAVAALEADGASARATCRLEFWRHPNLMAQFPFAHTIEVTHRLADGVLEVETLLQNHAVEPMPVSLGYHPFFQLHDAPRDSWKVHLPARAEMPLTPAFFPSGAMKPLDLPDPAPLARMETAYLLPELERGPDGRAEFRLEGVRERLSIVQGPKFPACVIYAPKGQDFICVEPMTATIDALNPAPEGRAPPAQSVAPGGEWRESFWIRFARFAPTPK